MSSDVAKGVQRRRIVRAGAGGKTPGLAHLLLTDDLLAVANGGRPLGREGLVALSGTGRSSKAAATPTHTPLVTPIEVQTALRDIRTTTLAQFRRNPGLVGASIRNEAAVAADLGKRLLIELLQNANDAMDGPPIGRRGAGFRAVGAVSDAPRVHSGALSVGFDRERSRRQLEAAKIAAEEVPLLRLPFAVPAAAESEAVRALMKRFATVVVLPLSNAAAHEMLAAHWERTSADQALLIRLPALRQVVWQRADAVETTTRTWTRTGSGVRVSDEGRPARPRPMVVHQPRRRPPGRKPAARLPGT